METDGSEAHRGSKSFKIDANDASGSATSARLVYNQIPATGEKEYTLAFWAKVDGSEAENRPLRLSVQGTTSPTSFFTRDIDLNSTDWKEYKFSFITDNLAFDSVYISLGISQVATNFWIDDFRFFEGMPADEFIKGDVNADGDVGAYDAALTLQFSALLVVPSDAQKKAADMNRDGFIASNDAIHILRKAAGLAAPGDDMLVYGGSPVIISLAEAYGLAGDRLTVPLTADVIDALAGGDIQIEYDPGVIRAVGVSHDPEVMMVSNITEPGTVWLSFVNPEPMKTNRIASIQFDMLVDDASTLAIRNADLYSPEGLPLASGTVDKRIVSWAVPPEYSALLQNFPNPFNPDTWIPYQLREDSEVVINIFNLRGEVVRTFELGQKSAGVYVSQDRAVHWDGRNDVGEIVASGLYFYRIKAGDFHAVKKLTVVR